MRVSSSRPSICFVAPFAYPVLAGDRAISFAGGAEVQQTVLARELVARGYKVSMICMNFGQPDGIVIDGITVHRIHAPDAGLPALRFLHPRLTSLWKALRGANADIYYQRAAGALTAFVSVFARRHGKLSVFAGAHDLDFDPRLPLISFGRDRALFRWGLRRAAAVVVQSEAQRVACKKHFGRPSTLIRSCYGHRGSPARHEGPVLWVATVKPHKRPELFLELAKRCPAYLFRLVGGGDVGYVQSIRAQLSGIPNVEMTGFVPFADVERHFDGASVFINTSEGEGFPNTFLQAWSRGIPTLSFFDPQIEWQGDPVGETADSLESMAAILVSLKENRQAWQQAGDTCCGCYSAKFAISTAVDDYEKLFAELTMDHRQVIGARE